MCVSRCCPRCHSRLPVFPFLTLSPPGACVPCAPASEPLGLAFDGLRETRSATCAAGQQVGGLRAIRGFQDWGDLDTYEFQLFCVGGAGGGGIRRGGGSSSSGGGGGGGSGGGSAHGARNSRSGGSGGGGEDGVSPGGRKRRRSDRGGSGNNGGGGSGSGTGSGATGATGTGGASGGTRGAPGPGLGGSESVDSSKAARNSRGDGEVLRARASTAFGSRAADAKQIARELEAEMAAFKLKDEL